MIASMRVVILASMSVIMVMMRVVVPVVMIMPMIMVVMMVYRDSLVPVMSLDTETPPRDTVAFTTLETAAGEGGW